MRPTNAARDTTPHLTPPLAPPDVPLIRIPTRALTADGFRAWAASEPVAPGIRLSHAGDGVLIAFEETDLRLLVPASAGTLDGFIDWIIDEDSLYARRFAFLDPEILIDMNGEEVETHVKMKLAITLGLGRVVEDLELGEFLPDGVLYSMPAVGLANIPDASFLKWKTSSSGRARFVPRRKRQGHTTIVEGAPDWVLEVVSDSSVGKDTRDLRDRYRRAGVREYWLIDARGAAVKFTVLVLRGNRYVAARPRDGWFVSPVFGRAFRLERSRNRAGRRQYKLLHRPA